MASIAADIGIAPFFFSWGRCHYDHSIVEQLRDHEAECEVLREVMNKGGLFAKWSGNTSMSLGYLLELYMRFTKEAAPVLDEDGQSWIKASSILPAIQQNKENLLQFLDANKNVIHKPTKPNDQHIHVFWHVLREKNILRLHDYHTVTFNLQYVVPLNGHEENQVILVPLQDDLQEVTVTSEEPALEQTTAADYRQQSRS